MTLHVSLDIETLSTKATALVLSVGICLFDDEKWQPYEEIVENGIELFFNRKEQIIQKRDVRQATIDWWSQQGASARRVLDAEDLVPIRDFHHHWEAFCEKKNVSVNWLTRKGKVFTRGPHFDIAIIEDMFDDFGVSPPWKFYNVRDIRTWLDCHGFNDNAKLVKPDSMIAHNALHDAAFDAFMMLEVLHKPKEDLDFEINTN